MARLDRTSEPCAYCGGRFIVAPGYDRHTERMHHEAECPLSVDCGYCSANISQRCHTPTGKTCRPHSSRDLIAQVTHWPRMRE